MGTMKDEEVMCANGLPKETGWYRTNLGSLYYSSTVKEWRNGSLNYVHPLYWIKKDTDSLKERR